MKRQLGCLSKSKIHELKLAIVEGVKTYKELAKEFEIEVGNVYVVRRQITPHEINSLKEEIEVKKMVSVPIEEKEKEEKMENVVTKWPGKKTDGYDMRISYSEDKSKIYILFYERVYDKFKNHTCDVSVVNDQLVIKTDGERKMTQSAAKTTLKLVVSKSETVTELGKFAGKHNLIWNSLNNEFHIAESEFNAEGQNKNLSDTDLKKAKEEAEEMACELINENEKLKKEINELNKAISKANAEVETAKIVVRRAENSRKAAEEELEKAKERINELLSTTSSEAAVDHDRVISEWLTRKIMKFIDEGEMEKAKFSRELMLSK